MFWFKGCPRCCCDLYVDQHQYGSFVSCLQCGLNRELASQPGEPRQIRLCPLRYLNGMETTPGAAGCPMADVTSPSH